MSNKQEEYIRMTEAPVAGLVLKLSVPTICSNLITTIYNLADTYFVSSLGNSATSAVGIVFPIQYIIQAVGFGFGMGAQSLISRRLGEKRDEEANMYGISAFAGAFLVGLLFLCMGFVNLPGLLRFFGATSTALPYACRYGKIILISAPLFCSSCVLNNILRSEGKAAWSMVGLCSGGIINIGLDYLFIVVYEMGISGAALATMLSQLISFLILVFFFASGKTIIELRLSKISRNLRDYVLIFKTGLPTVFRQSLGSVSSTLLNVAVRPYGDAAMAAVCIANKIYMLIRGMLVGVGQGFQPVAGYNFGAGLYARVRKAFNTSAILGTVIGILASGIIFFNADGLMALFRKGDIEVIVIGGRMLGYLCIPLLVLGYSTCVNQLYQCLGFVAPATFLASLRQGIFFVPLILILPRLLGLDGVLMTQALADGLTFAVSIFFHINLLRKHLPVDRTIINK